VFALFTIGRQTSAAPKIRYNLKDFGGVMAYRDLREKLREHDINISDLPGPQSHFPILFGFGRADLTVPFYGAKVYPTDVEDIPLQALSRRVGRLTETHCKAPCYSLARKSLTE
jgi:phenylacetate-coenzyme A ligase PaaK-like adenylate-forming protein